MADPARQYFYKYVSRDTSKIILTNRTVRWSSPRLFNDPFDTQIDLNFAFDFDDLAEPLGNELIRIIESGSGIPEKIIADKPYLGTLEVMRQMFNGKLSPDLRNKILEIFPEHTQIFRELLPKLQDKIREEFRNKSLLCVSELHDNLLMWSHYADQHKGAVLEFKCIPDPDYDTPLCAAKPVEYQREMPIFATLEDFIAGLLGQEERHWREQIFNKIAFTKSIDWVYEREWRCVTELRNPDGPGYEDIPFFPQEITKIYLGCRMIDRDIDEILGLLTGDFAHVVAYQARKSPESFGLDFKRIN